MTRSSRPSSEDGIPPNVEASLDNTSRSQVETINEVNGKVLPNKPKKMPEMPVAPDGAERQEAVETRKVAADEVGRSDDGETQAAKPLEEEAQKVADGQIIQRVRDNAYIAATKDETETDIQNSGAKGYESRGRGSVNLAMSSLNEDQSISHKAHVALDPEFRPEQSQFFDVQFDKSSKEYTVFRLQHSIPDWQQLNRASEFTLQDETFRRGDIIHIKLHDQTTSQAGDDVACIEDIRVLAKSDKRKLVLIAWLYLTDGRYYRSNHLQIVLWDTITRRATQLLARQVHSTQLYNVCEGKRFCSEKQAGIWRERKARILGDATYRG